VAFGRYPSVYCLFCMSQLFRVGCFLGFHFLLLLLFLFFLFVFLFGLCFHDLLWSATYAEGSYRLDK